MPAASSPEPSSQAPPDPHARRTLAAASVNHALHDGYTDLIYVLLPVWQGEFGLGYTALGLLKALYSGALAAFKLPASALARRLGTRTVLALGTALSAGGYAAAGASGGLVGLCVALAIAGIGSGTQHPLASAVIARAYGGRARGPLGTYNFAGDVGKAAVPPTVGFLLAFADWRTSMWAVAGLGLVVAALLTFTLPPARARQVPDAAAGVPAAVRQGREMRRDGTGFPILVAIGMLDNAARPAFLLYLPFLLREKGAALTTIGLALSAVFVGGALGKAVCGWLGERLGVTRTVLLTESGTAALILAAIVLPLVPALIILPLLGVMLNGTSSVLYGTVPELAPNGQVERAFALFYTWTLGGSAVAMPLLYGPLGDVFRPSWAATASAATALAAVPLMLALSGRLPPGSSRRV